MSIKVSNLLCKNNIALYSIEGAFISVFKKSNYKI